jgi:hypothetical protein
MLIQNLPSRTIRTTWETSYETPATLRAPLLTLGLRARTLQTSKSAATIIPPGSFVWIDHVV